MLGRFLVSLTARSRLTMEEAARRASLKKRKATKAVNLETSEDSPLKDVDLKRPKVDREVIASIPAVGETSANTGVDLNAILPPEVYEKFSAMGDSNMFSHGAEHILQV